MSKLFENAVTSIQLGVEDYQANDTRRTISAVRNFYAGVLLLAKETLVRAAPEADLKELIAAKYKPVSDGKGGVDFVPDGQSTIDFATIARRFKDFDLTIDQNALADLNRIRNDVEHYYTETPKETVREAVAKGFPVVVQLFEQIGEHPKVHLSDAWDIMLDTKALYEAELKACKETFETVDWTSDTIRKSGLQCPDCGSSLIRQEDPDNTEQKWIELSCRACGSTPSIEKAISEALEKALTGERFLRAKDAGEDGPIFYCTECGNNTYVDFEESCAVCGHEYGREDCVRCGSGLTMDEVIYGEGGLCSYCAHMTAKIMRE